MSAGWEFRTLGEVSQEELPLPSRHSTALTGDGHVEVGNERDGVPLRLTSVFINMYLHAEELSQAGQNTIISFSSHSGLLLFRNKLLLLLLIYKGRNDGMKWAQ